MVYYNNLFNINGNSMYPLIEEGDKVVIAKYNDELEIKEGDIIVCIKKNGLGAHRVVFLRRRKNKYYTKGDNRLLFDSPVNFDKIVGKVIIVIKRNKIISLKSNSIIKVVKKIIIFSLIIGSISSILIIKYGILKNSSSTFIKLYKKLCFEWLAFVIYTKKIRYEIERS